MSQSRDQFQISGLPRRVLNAYRLYMPVPPVPDIHPFDPSVQVSDCGHGFDHLFNLDKYEWRIEKPWSPYDGFTYLNWAASEWQENRVLRVQNKLVDNKFSPFVQQFLIECLGRTAFARICASKIRSVFKKEGFGDPITTDLLPAQFSRIDTSLEDRTLCVYLDGLAALKAKAPLSENK
ncbi:MAG: hypothetical protein AABY88_01905 [Pseudomonadota bacterium]